MQPMKSCCQMPEHTTKSWQAQIVRVTSDALQIDPILVAPVVALPIILLLLILLFVRSGKKKPEER